MLRHPIVILAFLIVGSLVITMAGIGVVADVAALKSLAKTANPYFVPAHFFLLYIATPLATLAATVLLIIPGLLFVTCFSRSSMTFASWLLKGFAVSLLSLSVAMGCVELITDAPIALQGRGFAAVVAIISAFFLLGTWQRDRSKGIDWDRFIPNRTDVLIMVLVPTIVLLMMTPKFYWESFNGDGAHEFLGTRLLMYSGLPFWPKGSDLIGSYPAITAFLEFLPNALFMRLFGEFEFSVRMGCLSALSVLAVLLSHLATANYETEGQADSSTRSTWHIAFGISCALILYSAVLAFSASYNPYYADVALPMSREPMVMISFLGFIVFFLQDRKVWTGAFAFLTLISVPSAPVLLGFWLISVFLVWSPRPWKRLILTAGLIALSMLAAQAFLWILGALANVGVEGELNAGNLAGRLRYVTFSEIERMGYWVIPCGIVPAVALLFWRWQDKTARALTLVTIAYVGFFYFQAYRVLPHHFAPAMILPLVVFWRLRLVVANPLPAIAVAIIGLTVAGYIARPAALQPNMVGSDLGARIVFEGSRYDEFYPQEIAIAHNLLRSAFPAYYEDDAPSKHYIASPLVWYVYAVRPKANDQEINYVIRKAGQPLGEGEYRLAEDGAFELVTNNRAAYAQDKSGTGLIRSISHAFYVRRSVIFGSGEREGTRPVWDVVRILGLR